MRHLSALLMMISCAVPPARAKTVEELLKLAVNPTEESYCRGDAEVAFLHIRARMDVKNESKDTAVSLSKADLHVDYIQVVKKLEDFSRKEYVANISTTSVVGSSVDLDHLGSSAFITIPQGESRLLEITFNLPVSGRTGAAVNGIIRPGSYIAVIYVSGWLGSQDLAGQVQAKLPSIGRVWQQPVPSLPIGIKVEPAPVIRYCQ